MATLEEENKILREYLWLNHGCSYPALYGDDGNMQCLKCMLDFKKDTIETIQDKFAQKQVEFLEKVYSYIEGVKALDLIPENSPEREKAEEALDPLWLALDEKQMELVNFLLDERLKQRG